MRPSLSWIFPLLLVFALITAVPVGQAGNSPLEPPLLPIEAAATVPTSGQVSSAGAGAEPIVLAAARNLPTGVETPRPKKARKAKGPAEGSGCEGGKLQVGTGEDIVIDSSCTVNAGTYHYGFVNIVNGGTLNFKDQTIDFWAKSILVENEGSLIVGSPTDPIGNKNPGNVVTFHLYGDDNQTAGITCKTEFCGVDESVWNASWNPVSISLPSSVPGKKVMDYFYKYKTLPGDDVSFQRYPDEQEYSGRALTDNSYFGLKTLAVSYGGSLRMFGAKGASYQEPGPKDEQSGMSWVRLDRTVKAGGKELVLDRTVNWQEGDWIVVTATDYIPNHSEMRQIDSIDQNDPNKSVITLKEALSYPHNGQKYSLAKHDIPSRLSPKSEKTEFMKEVDTRAAVALLNRSIRIVSEGAGFNEPLPPESAPGTNRYFGGHVIARQGFKEFQMKGVELKQLGQGGRMAHSPVNFHMARKLPPEGHPNQAYVTDCSVNESMTRMYEIRGTQGAILKRNVGYMSIGHGYYLAEGAETNNLLKANIGIYARPAVDYRDNPRKVPGILSHSGNWGHGISLGKNQSDVVHPTVFYIGNGYNTFEDNMAVGAGTCGACYWIAPMKISGLSSSQSWSGYARIQEDTDGIAPLYRFHGNFCSTAQYSLMTIDSPGTCDGVLSPFDDDNDKKLKLNPLENPFRRSYDGSPELFPNIREGGVVKATICANPECTQHVPCAKGQTKNCAVNVIDSYTSSFHWAQQNFSAIWLRTNSFLFTDSALTDVLNGGLSMVSGGSWDQVINGYWALTRKSVFIGQTQDDNDSIYAQNQGPVNPHTIGKLTCLKGTDAAFCRVLAGLGTENPPSDEGIVIPRDNFSVYQRLYNIYDGPVYQETNAYLNIKQREVFGCDNNTGTCHEDTNFLYARANGIPKATEGLLKGKCSMPNAAIGWKQPNGFYYPPAFHSRNLFFDGVDIRHFVIVPPFKPGTLEVDVNAVTKGYCSYPTDTKTLFNNDWTDIDRQTEITDDDGSLSGLSGAEWLPDSKETTGTISVNKDQFYYAPKTPFECLSEQSCYQSPYDYVSAVVLPSGTPDNWHDNAEKRSSYGVPIYRQYLNQGEKVGEEQGIRMLGAAIFQRSTMVANEGKYYIDTAVSAAKQQHSDFRNEFKAGQKYNFFLIYAKPTTKVTFQLYVGKTPDVSFDNATAVKMVRVGVNRHTQHPQDSSYDDAKVLVDPQSADFITPDDQWPGKWSRTYHSDTGILEVTMDLAAFADEFEKAREESCGPASFCHWNAAAGKSGECRCAPQQYDANGQLTPIGFPCDNSSNVCSWSSYRSECPSGGCFGFQVAFPAGFVADDSTVPDGKSSYKPLHRPDPDVAFPASWDVKWRKAPNELSYDKSVHWDDHFYPFPGPCDYSNKDPDNAPLPSSVSTESTDD